MYHRFRACWLATRPTTIPSFVTDVRISTDTLEGLGADLSKITIYRIQFAASSTLFSA